MDSEGLSEEQVSVAGDQCRSCWCLVHVCPKLRCVFRNGWTPEEEEDISRLLLN